MQPADAGALARALLELLESPQRRDDLGKAGEHRARERFSVARMTDATLAVYDEALR